MTLLFLFHLLYFFHQDGMFAVARGVPSFDGDAVALADDVGVFFKNFGENHIFNTVGVIG